jgi:hypothetical protein
MILYNVTVNILEDDKHEAFLLWMKDTHIPEVMQTGKFTDYRMYRIISNPMDEEAVSYCIQYFAESMDDYSDYHVNHAPALQEKFNQKYGGSCYAIRTIMEKV